MSLNQIAFLGLAAMSLLGAIMVVTTKKPLYSILYLIFTFFCIAAHFVILNAQFLAVVQVIVYAGAIMVLFLFVVMLLNLNKESEYRKPALLKVAAAMSGGMLLLLTVAGVVKSGAGNVETAEAALYTQTTIGYVSNLGLSLFKEYLIPFEVVSILFLSAMVGAVVLGRKD
ncbi:MAG TPA: NADH-quinone oxidoreductase subunit J [Chitinophagales bacterium]|nr:NADH-quinone oxidoreductase subunit J [Chitinophagales bacterium]